MQQQRLTGDSAHELLAQHHLFPCTVLLCYRDHMHPNAGPFVVGVEVALDAPDQAPFQAVIIHSGPCGADMEEGCTEFFEVQVGDFLTIFIVSRAPESTERAFSEAVASGVWQLHAGANGPTLHQLHVTGIAIREQRCHLV